ncbi:lycopene cyclase domain-containing protein [Subtercola sp. PAMC28395]|uniref:lycopene cyclase domain-containing protein n=1 Tax=Subtercola sp. PAMC28395 TaxID=2846775 RepID=UPI001C0DEAAA|nr:lycopene cyclase domain-containing protein [Subtercola sp. PAMC28395]QWT24741.1 lycopene cyclase domain-containing protein [Subtercola sp. PAMC28395]
MAVLYLLGLLVALTGMVMLDRRFRLFFWADARRASIVLVVGVVFFLLWDIAGIGLGIFFRGETAFTTGIVIGRELPLEEVFFLTLLCYLTMNLFAAVSRMIGRATVAPNGTRGQSGLAGRSAGRPS